MTEAMAEHRSARATGSRLPNDCFALPPGVDWTPVDDALAALKTRMAPIAAVETIPLTTAAGRVLARDALAVRAHPACDNAAVDGYAFAHPGAPRGAMLSVTLREGRSAAGAPWSGSLGPGEAVRILTGAAMPAGADTVVLQEDVETVGETIRFPAPGRPGANRRRMGENLAVGALALGAGARITPQATAQLAAAGLAEVSAYRPLTVALMSTGDELAEPGVGLAPDRVIDSNRPMLAALLQGLGCDVLDLGRIPDDAAAVAAALDRAVAEADVLVASGGASGGDEDHVARLLAQGAETEPSDAFHLWRIAVKPGRPLAMALRRGAPVFGLPGNPVAAFVCFLIFVRPALLALGGAGWRTPRAYPTPLGFDYPKKVGRREYLRVRMGADGRLEKYRSEGSGLIEGLIWSDGLVDLAHDAGPVAAGDLVSYLPFAEFGVAG